MLSKHAEAANQIIALLYKRAADLSKPENRAHVAKKDFVMPGGHPKGESHAESHGKYPVPDKSHARAAMGFCAMHHGSGSSECSAVRAKVHSKFPGMGDKKGGMPMHDEAHEAHPSMAHEQQEMHDPHMPHEEVHPVRKAIDHHALHRALFPHHPMYHATAQPMPHQEHVTHTAEHMRFQGGPKPEHHTPETVVD